MIWFWNLFRLIYHDNDDRYVYYVLDVCLTCCIDLRTISERVWMEASWQSTFPDVSWHVLLQWFEKISKFNDIHSMTIRKTNVSDGKCISHSQNGIDAKCIQSSSIDPSLTWRTITLMTSSSDLIHRYTTWSWHTTSGSAQSEVSRWSWSHHWYGYARFRWSCRKEYLSRLLCRKDLSCRIREIGSCWWDICKFYLRRFHRDVTHIGFGSEENQYGDHD